MNVPFGALIVTINEKLKEKMVGDGSDSILKYFISAGMAGLLAAVPTCPLDVIKTRLNTQNCMNKMCGMDRVVCSTMLKDNISTYQNKISAYHSYGTLTEKLIKVGRGAVPHIKYHSVMDAAKKIYK
jgi:hypothetical protein